MKNLKEMMKKRKKNNKGFSLVELIVVIAIMVVLVAVLGSTILGYVERSRYSKDIQALDAVKTAVSTYVAEGGADTADDETTLADLIERDDSDVITNILSEVFDGEDFNASSNAFEGHTTENVLVNIDGGAVSIFIATADGSDPYTCGTAYDEDGVLNPS